MSILHAIILGLIQGLTEFIPVSSSGHLVLAHHAFGITESGLGFDVALHVGTLAALLVCFRQDIWRLIQAVWQRKPEARLAWLILAATVPAAIAGFLLEDRAETVFRSPRLVAMNLFIVALIMLFAEEYYHRKVLRPTKLPKTKFDQAMVMGVAQAVALVPGVSRSGSTITAGLLVGMERVAATRFSFLLGIPIMCGALAKILTESTTRAAIGQESMIFAVGIITAFASGMLAIRFLLTFLGKHSLAVFAYYRMALAVLVLVLMSTIG